MLFHSLDFALFLPLVFFLYWWLGRKGWQQQNKLLLLANFVFYGSWDIRFLGLIVISSFTDYWVGLKIAASEGSHMKRWWLGVSLLVNLGILGFFKYFNFFLESLLQLAGWLGISMSPSTLQILLPVGISFYTFQTLSYTIDIYRGKLQPTRDWVAFFSFVSFFPQLVAGPIERAGSLLPQFERARTFNIRQATRGLRLFLWGLFKKVVVADGLGVYVDYLYHHPEEATGLSWWIASALFGLQVYADFSAYSTMARGIARLFGFELIVNFRTPFFSSTIREFWSRWHISLSTWFRDYIYFPLGGNRSSRSRWAFNIILTFMVSGIWHGAGWGYILFGLFHGIGYVLEQTLFREKEKWEKPIKRLIPLLFAHVLILFAWNLFRSASTPFLRLSVKGMLDVFSWKWSGSGFWLEAQSWQMGLALLFSCCLMLTLEWYRQDGEIDLELDKWPLAARWSFYYFLTIWIFLTGQFSVEAPFIYFQF